MISFEDFKKLEIKIGKVLEAEKIPESNKLVKLIFDIGGEKRQIIAGIGEAYPDPTALIGKEMPVLVNLEPKSLMGYESQGMLLAVSVSGKPILLQPEMEVPPGSIVH
mgnify:FL=1